MNQPLISIIIPTYNRAHLICETLDSVLAQTYKNWECIIVDDGSTDNTQEIIQKHIKSDNRFFVTNRKENNPKGPSSCRNFGINKSKGEYILFLDSDDLLAPICLENRLETAKKHSQYDFYIFKTQIFFDEISNLGKIFNMKLNDYTKEIYLNNFFKGEYPFCVCSVLWKKSVLKQIDGFDENLKVLEDPDLHIRALMKNFKPFTSMNNFSDSFYRKSSTVVLNKTFYQNLVSSKYIFYKKYISNVKKIMKPEAINFYRITVLSKGNSYNAIKFYLLFIKNRILSFRQIILIPILIFIKIFNLNNIKGVGFHRLSIFALKDKI